ncbi:DNA (cytosine-5)-methyltransferase 1-like [Arctopsyche grandis]|uniref:DNA (cytosine-5)-methyltransferase 1-like n=1 Tax=Arctopsyche grandis TaxID=121162 RepID=UPI00406D8BF4
MVNKLDAKFKRIQLIGLRGGGWSETTKRSKAAATNISKSVSTHRMANQTRPCPRSTIIISSFEVYGENKCFYPLYISFAKVPLLYMRGQLSDGVFAENLGPVIDWSVNIEEKKIVVTSKNFTYVTKPSRKYKSLYFEAVTKCTVSAGCIKYLNAYQTTRISLKILIARNSNESILKSSCIPYICSDIFRWVQNLEPDLRWKMRQLPCLRTAAEKFVEECVEIHSPFTPLVSKIVSEINDPISQYKYRKLELCPNVTQKKCERCRKCLKGEQCEYPKKWECYDKNCPTLFKQEGYKNYFEIRHEFESLQFLGNPLTISGKQCYSKISFGAITLGGGDFVLAKIKGNQSQTTIVKLSYVWKESDDSCGMFHGQVFIEGCYTVLGSVADCNEIFLCSECCDEPVSNILAKIHVDRRDVSKTYKIPSTEIDHMLYSDIKNIYYSKVYCQSSGRFTDIPADPPNVDNALNYCSSCSITKEKLISEIPRFEMVSDRNETKFYQMSSLFINGFKYNEGVAVFITNDNIFNEAKCSVPSKINVDGSIFTEMYRKANSPDYGGESPKPYQIGYISYILVNNNSVDDPENVKLVVNLLIRPEDTKMDESYTEDLGSVYWTDRTEIIGAKNLIRPVDLIYRSNIPENTTLSKWCNEGTDRFYINGIYNLITKKLEKVVPDKIRRIGSHHCSTSSHSEPVEKLCGFDLFGGCGGFAYGMSLSGAVDIKWCIENDVPTSLAYKMNFPECEVYTEDVNVVLSAILKGGNVLGEPLPLHGEVDLLMCSPPCQGFSSMNRFSDGEQSIINNSLIFSSLSFFDIYRPKYFILENVANLAIYENGLVMRTILSMLLQCGYQCGYYVLQAANFGVPQARRRLFIVASAPGYKLTEAPRPTHSFNHKMALTVTLNNLKTGPAEQCTLAPKRTCTIRDAISDLWTIDNGSHNFYIPYEYDGPKCEFQRQMRSRTSPLVSEHCCKRLNEINYARVSRVPFTPGADWRDLPNVPLTLPSGDKLVPLNYEYPDKNGVMRGVCKCIRGSKCSAEPQCDSLIPWFLPHSADKHSNWVGVLGRLSWDGQFNTTLTEPNPLGKQGSVIHPSQNRVLSIRECARSQGIPDDFVLVGSSTKKYAQVGNAVPPALGRAISHEILKGMKESDD